ncbi:hypothetical protein PLICRDRAFT_212561 [Plicaturopsis crispa FD-325 SS-3]|nr:hypothetical protein PLICRDRAFT_212561 [Plicaturopsis crispa FD-325 SS-3]
MPEQQPVGNIAEITAFIESLEAEEAGLSCRLAEVRALLSQSRAHVAELANRTARVYSLPPELLSRILEHVSQEEHHEMSRYRTSFPLVISQVSRHWRAVALATSSLWAFICAPQSLKYMERSKGQGLRIHLHYEHALDPKYILRHMSLLTPHVERWVEFIAVLPTTSLMGGIVTALADLMAPRLEFVDLSIEYNGYNVIFEDGYSVFMGGAPRLRTFHVYETSPPVEWPPHSDVTELRLQQYNRASDGKRYIYHSLTSLPSLQRLAIEGCFYDSALVADVRVVLPDLKHLLIAGDGWPVESEYLGILFDVIVAPSLVSLVIKDLTSPERKALLKKIKSVPDFSASYPVLRSLTIVGTEANLGATEENRSVNIIPVFPSITHLTLGYELDDVIPRLVQLHDVLLKDSSCAVCPALHTLTFLWPKIREYPVHDEVSTLWGMLFKLLDARRLQAPNRPIERVRLDTTLRAFITAATVASLGRMVNVEWVNAEQTGYTYQLGVLTG